MLFAKRRNERELTRPEIDYANDLLRMFQNRELKENEITRENVEKIIKEYSSKLCRNMQQYG